MSLTSLLGQALDGYVQIETAKAGAGMDATANQQAQIQQPTAPGNVEAKAGSINTDLISLDRPWMKPALYVAAGLAALLVVKRLV